MSEQRQEAQKSQTEFLRNRQVERELDTRALQEVRMELQRIAPLEQGLAVGRAEERRLNESLLRLQGEFEAIDKRLTQGEEGRRLLADAIEKNTVGQRQTEGAVQELQKEQRGLLARTVAAETGIKRLEQQMAGLETMRQEITKQQDELLEAGRRADQARATALTEWGRRMEGHAHQLEVWADQLRHFTDQHEKSRRVLREVQEVSHEVSQQQDRLRQLQRLAEEQLHRELREMQVESERLWTKERERREAADAARARVDDAERARLVAAEEALTQHQALLQALSDRVAVLREEFTKQVDQQTRSQMSAWNSLAGALTKVATDLRGAAGEDAPKAKK
jgi:DNA repair exonuclease SbcCD ATPase subunit